MISRQTRHALQALGRLGDNPAGEPILIADLANGSLFPASSSRRSSSRCARAVLHSRAGRGGGYQLALPAGEITLARIVRLLDDEFAPLPCLDPAHPSRCDECDECDDLDTCGTRLVMADVRQAVTGCFPGLSLLYL